MASPTGPIAASSVKVEDKDGSTDAAEAPKETPWLSRPERLEQFIGQPSHLSLFNTCSMVIHGKSADLTPEEILVFINIAYCSVAS